MIYKALPFLFGFLSGFGALADDRGLEPGEILFQCRSESGATIGLNRGDERASLVMWEGARVSAYFVSAGSLVLGNNHVSKYGFSMRDSTGRSASLALYFNSEFKPLGLKTGGSLGERLIPCGPLGSDEDLASEYPVRLDAFINGLP